MNSLFHEWLDDFVIVYLDDILIYSPDKESHQRHLDLVFQRLTQHQWYCKLKKCDFRSHISRILRTYHFSRLH